MADSQVAWADFDAILCQFTPEMRRISEFLGFRADPARIEALERAPLMGRYSKDLGYEYSPAIRRELIEEAAAHFKSEIDGALAMLGRAAEKSPLLARTLERAREA